MLVEPGQAQLLAQLARKLRDVRQAPPGGSLPRVEVVPVEAAGPPVETTPPPPLREYREEWRAVEGVWPLIHRSVPAIGR